MDTVQHFDGRFSFVKKPVTQYTTLAVLLVTVATLALRLAAAVPIASVGSEIAPAMVLRAVQTSATETELKMLKSMVEEQQRRQNENTLQNAVLRWWPILIVGAGILITYGMQKQWAVEMNKRTEEYSNHIKDTNAHWTEREREEITENIKQIRHILDTHYTTVAPFVKPPHSRSDQHIK